MMSALSPPASRFPILPPVLSPVAKAHSSHSLSTKPPSPFMALSDASSGVGMWSDEEHARFLEGVKLFANGPWKRVADYVGTRSVRQTMTHAQKYRLKAARRLRNLRAKNDLLQQHSGRSSHTAGGSSATLQPKLLPLPEDEDEADGSLDELLEPPTAKKPRKVAGARRRRHSASLDSVSITDAMSILDAALVAPLATTDGRATAPKREQTRPAVAAATATMVVDPVTTFDLIDFDVADADLEGCPSLEDCAVELLDLLF